MKEQYNYDVDDQFLENDETIRDKIHEILNDNKVNTEREYSGAFSSTLLDSGVDEERLPTADNTNNSLNNNTEDNAIELNEETELKTVYEPCNIDNNGLDSNQNLESDDYTTHRTTVLETFVKSHIVTSADRSELYGLLIRNFFFDKGNHGIEPQELLNRKFGMPILVMEICRAPMYISDETEEERFLDSCPILVNRDDEACINSYIGSRGFQFQCRRENHCFYFGVGSREWDDVNAEISRMERELRMLCFGRLYGRNVAGRKIKNAGDLLLTFGTFSKAVLFYIV